MLQQLNFNSPSLYSASLPLAHSNTISIIIPSSPDLNMPSSMTTRVDHLSPEAVHQELETFLKTPGFVRPERSKIDSSRPWREGVPNYDTADLAFFRGKTRSHEPGSLAYIVENAVKSWEMEATHLNFIDWHSVNHKAYAVSANGGRRFEGEEGARAGNYNWLMENVQKDLYDAEKETFESSHSMFRTAFPGGFPWEVLEVFSGPPRVSFSWRHWAAFDGSFRGREGDGKTYDMYGFGVIDLDEELKVKEIEIYYKPADFIKALHGDIPVDALKDGKALVGNTCPVASKFFK